MTPVPETEPQWRQLKREFAHELNQLFRRFRQYEKEADWVSLVMEGISAYARQAALFAVQGSELELRGSINLELPELLRLDSKNAAAFSAVLQSKEAVTALRSRGEVGALLASDGELAYLFPILNDSRVAAVLFAAAEDSELDRLELIANMAGSVLERSTNRDVHAKIAVAPTPPKTPEPLTLPAWAGMPPEQRALHSLAARYARVTVAEMQLLKPAVCRTAQEKGGLYVLLSKEIDKARETYRKQFMTIPSMTDYFHRELVSSVLRGDATKLGADYPGELSQVG
jgi:hypothetical protein